jgi:peptide deformylase
MNVSTQPYKVLRRTQFGNPILRQTARRLTDTDINSQAIQTLIQNLYFTLETKQYGVGLSAPQIGESIALAVIGIKPTPTRPELNEEKLLLINPVIIKNYGSRTGMWEACISGSELYGKVLRYKKIRLRWTDETTATHERDFTGFLAHVVQHEVDHLNGILFVDRVVDTHSYMTFSEFNKHRKQKLL